MFYVLLIIIFLVYQNAILKFKVQLLGWWCLKAHRKTAFNWSPKKPLQKCTEQKTFNFLFERLIENIKTKTATPPTIAYFLVEWKLFWTLKKFISDQIKIIQFKWYFKGTKGVAPRRGVDANELQ